LRSSVGVKLSVFGGWFIFDGSVADDSENRVNHGGH
jgi:hypothetical protein